MLKVSAFCLDNQKSFVPKKVPTPWLTPIGVNQGVGVLGTKLFCLSRQNAEILWGFMKS